MTAPTAAAAPARVDVLAVMDAEIAEIAGDSWMDDENEAKQRAREAAMREARATVEAVASALDRLLPFAVHADSCGDRDAYNNASFPSCGCGLDSVTDAAHEALAAFQGSALAQVSP